MANKKVEEPEHVSSSSSESASDDEQHDEGAQQEQQDGEGSSCRSRQSRNEKKARKAVLRLGMKPMPEIVKVVIRKAKQAWFVLPKPDVFKSLSSDTYVIFGQAENMASQAHTEAAQRFTQGALPFGATDQSSMATGNVAAAKATAPAPSAATEEVDMEGVDPKDVELIVSQLRCSKSEAAKALRENNNDLVEAILHITAC
ncbi:nascent polypeptide-associated complex subunit alpha-like protein 3 [Cyclospora cayetanensis]|uniref:Nascent polypeptide-associated complex subunit alpha-like protein 3 n=1 Tax=Cyclospora cayetanensis TaxID=88456 RepID=A0A6P6RUU0_9EIME|nr:nascent polypeptide-associated complex subunit alpha-like protein 3 [Cyclospora cayetanensis]